jgi:uncharacterized LabA/DUF88 family protein
MEDNNHFALLIDSDNVSAKYMKGILDEMTKHGTVTYKRIYGDWTSSQTARWKDMLAENSVTPIQQFANTMGKNATDSTLIIDAMDILYTGNVKGFCIVSSDSDFTRLASRLRESGMTVIGMGEEKTPKSFRAACSIFTNLEVLITDEENQPDGQVSTAKKRRRGTKGDGVSKSAVRDAIIDIINENNDQGKPTSLAEVGSRLVNKYPDFDVRNFGYSVLSKFLEEFENLELIKREDSVFVKLSEDKRSQDEVATFIRTGVEFRGVDGIDLGVLGTMVHEEFPHFNVKDYGFSQFSKFVRAIEGITIADDENGLDHVYPDAD